MKSIQESILVANWKTNPKNQKEAIKLFKDIIKSCSVLKKKIIICSPNIFIPVLSKIKSPFVSLGLQNTSFEDTGAYTGQTSIAQALPFKVSFVILGHSEVRQLGETSELINKKIKYTLKKGVTPIVCVGEQFRDQEHTYFTFIQKQLVESFYGLQKKDFPKIVIAYEPIWAIGKNALRDATAEEFFEIKIFIHKVLKDVFKLTDTFLPKILYGGSVDDKDGKDFIHGGADGLLIGRASLDVKKMSLLMKSIIFK